MQKREYIIITVLTAVTCSIISVLFLVSIQKQDNLQFGGNTVYESPRIRTASSSTFTLTTTSLRLLGTTTATRRLAATIQPVNCTAGSAVFLNIEGSDAAATAANGMAAYASTTLELETYPGVPVVQNAVQGIVPSGTCTVLVNEFLAPY